MSLDNATRSNSAPADLPLQLPLRPPLRAGSLEIEPALPPVADAQQNPVMAPTQMKMAGQVNLERLGQFGSHWLPNARHPGRPFPCRNSPRGGFGNHRLPNLEQLEEPAHVSQIALGESLPILLVQPLPQARQQRFTVTGPAGFALNLGVDHPPHIPIQRHHRKIRRRHRPVPRLLN